MDSKYKKGQFRYIIVQMGSAKKLYRVEFGDASESYQIANIIDDISEPLVLARPFRYWDISKKVRRKRVEKHREYVKNRYFLLNLHRREIETDCYRTSNIKTEGKDCKIYHSFKQAKEAFDGDKTFINKWYEKNIPIIRKENLELLLA